MCNIELFFCDNFHCNLNSIFKYKQINPKQPMSSSKLNQYISVNSYHVHISGLSIQKSSSNCIRICLSVCVVIVFQGKPIDFVGVDESTARWVQDFSSKPYATPAKLESIDGEISNSSTEHCNRLMYNSTEPSLQTSM